MNEPLQEYVDSRGVPIRIDRQSGVIRGVKLLGLKSRNGRSYLPDALDQAAALYEGAKVNVNHAKRHPLAPRDYQDRIGSMRNVQVRRDEGLFADFHYNPKHALSEQLLWDAQHAPENVGFSHNVLARTSRHGDQIVVEAITAVESVDLVADPATTEGLFEAAPPTPSLAELTADQLRRQRADLVDELLYEQLDEVGRLRAEVERLALAEAVSQKRQLITRLLGEAELPALDAEEPWAKAIVGGRFVDALLAAPDETTIHQLIAERAELVRSAARRCLGSAWGPSRPQSREQHPFELASPPDSAAFVRAIT